MRFPLRFPLRFPMMSSKANCTFLASAAFVIIMSTAAFSADTELSGSLKNVFSDGKMQSGSDYWSDLTRLRLELDATASSETSVKIIYDNEMSVGTVLDTAEFNAGKDLRDDAYFDLSHEVSDSGDLYWRHKIYRAYGTWTDDELTVIVGRQRVAWGQTRIWNPTDLFNPVSPFVIESGERLGIDALSIEHSFGPLSSVHVVYGPGRTSSDETAGARVRGNIKGYDLSIIFGEFRQKEVYGLDFAGSVGESGVRGEWTRTDPSDSPAGGEDYDRLVLSVDHSFPSTLYVLVEYLYNEGAVGRNAPLAALTNFSGEIVTRNRRFLAANVGYEFHPLIRGSVTSIYDKDGEGFFTSPSVSYNIKQSVDLTLGAQLFRDKGEYAGTDNLWYAVGQWYF